jgi:death on curing protein
VIALHDSQLREHAGLSGVRDLGLVQSALARPQNLAHYGKPDVVTLAAAYVYGLAKNHGFVDGNKRTAYVTALVFLLDNGFDFIGEDADSVVTMLAVASNKMNEDQLAEWFRKNIRRIKH